MLVVCYLIFNQESEQNQNSPENQQGLSKDLSTSFTALDICLPIWDEPEAVSRRAWLSLFLLPPDVKHGFLFFLITFTFMKYY